MPKPRTPAPAAAPEWYEIRAAAGAREAEVLVYGDIGASWDEESVTASRFVRELQALDVDYITARINSYGGSVPDGVAIYNALRRHPAAVTVAIDGVALSIASLIAMAGDTVQMAANAMLMIHAPWGMAIGNSAELRDYADTLDRFAAAMTSSYVTKSGQDQSAIMALLTDGKDHWYTAEEAMAEGFVDEITGSLAIAASLNIARFNPPAAAAARIHPEATMPKPDPNPAAPTTPTAAPSTPADPAEVTRIEEAAVARAHQAMAERNQALRAAYKPFMAHAGVPELLEGVIDDPKATLESGTAKLLAKLGEGAAPIAGRGTPRDPETGEETYEDKVAALEAEGKTRGQARAAVARDFPELHADWLRRINTGKE